MIKEARIATFVVRAKEAQEMADTVKDAEARTIWITIAEGYRNLARLTEAQEE